MKITKSPAAPQGDMIVPILMALVIGALCLAAGVHALVADFPPFEQLGHAKGKLADITTLVEGRGHGVAILLDTEKDYICLAVPDLDGHYADRAAFEKELKDKAQHSRDKTIDIWHYPPEILQRDFNRVAQISVDGEVLIRYEDVRDIWTRNQRHLGCLMTVIGFFMIAYAWAWYRRPAFGRDFRA